MSVVCRLAVSYTHLWRKAVYDKAVELLYPKLEKVKQLVDKGLEYLAAVSYTHLDVYKRQKKDSQKTILAEKSFWSVHGHGKINSADELYRSLRKWALPVIGTESVLRWMRAAIKQLRKFL